MKPHVVFLAAVSWHCPLAGRTRRLAEGLSRLGHSVTFVSVPGRRSYWNSWRCPNPAMPTITMPPIPACLRGGRLEQAWVRRLCRQLPKQRPLVVIVSTPRWAPVVDTLPGDVHICYDWLDDAAVHAGPSGRKLEQLRDDEERILRRSHFVLTVSPGLEAEANNRFDRSQILSLPNGVPEHWLNEVAKPIDLASKGLDARRPVAGFLGALFEWVDFELLAAAAKRLPHWQWILVGPRRREIVFPELRRLPNVWVGPATPHHEVPRWLATYDVCLIPFRQNRVTALADPIKAYEYCALGKPIVSTVAPTRPIPMRTVRSLEEFVQAIPEEAARNDSADRLHRRSFAENHTWERRVERLSETISQFSKRSAFSSRLTAA